jgi:autoinducer 2-degrading protein
MLVTLVYVHVKPESISEFIEASLENARGSVNEPGNVRFDVLQMEDDPTRFVLYEAYETAEDAAAHKGTQHYLKWRETVADWMAEPRQGVAYTGRQD